MPHDFMRGPFGKCLVETVAPKKCNQVQDATVHRRYRCRHGYCTHMADSIEQRDIHEENNHSDRR
jgi:hypothetical protein